VAVEGAEEAAELRQQRGEVPAGRREHGEGEEEAHPEQRRRRPHLICVCFSLSDPNLSLLPM